MELMKAAVSSSMYRTTTPQGPTNWSKPKDSKSNLTKITKNYNPQSVSLKIQKNSMNNLQFIGKPRQSSPFNIKKIKKASRSEHLTNQGSS